MLSSTEGLGDSRRRNTKPRFRWFTQHRDWLRVSGVLLVGLGVASGIGCSDDSTDASAGTGGSTTVGAGGSATGGAAGSGGSAGSAGMGGTAGAAGEAGAAGSSGTAGAGGQPEPCKPPDVVPDPWEITFAPQDRDTLAWVEGALLEVYLSDGTLLDSGISDAKGRVSMSIPTGGKPIDGYFMASKSGYMTTRYRIQGGLGWLPSWVTDMVPEAYADEFVAGTWALTPRDPNSAVAFVELYDCNKGSKAWGLPGGTISFEPEPAAQGVHYFGGASTLRDGYAIAANVPAGDNTITVSLDGTDTTYDRPMLANTWEALLLYPKAEPDCQPADMSSYVPDWKPSNGLAQGLCTDDQAEDYIDACWAPGHTSAQCNAFKADAVNAECLVCAFASSTAPNWNALIRSTQTGLVSQSNGSCISAVEGDVSADSCGAKYQAALGCARSACDDNCSIEAATSSLDVSRHNACFGEALEGECGAHWDAANACVDDLRANDVPVDPCLRVFNVDSFAAAAERLIKLTCGDGSVEVRLSGTALDWDGNALDGVDVCWYDNATVPCAASGSQGAFMLEGVPYGDVGALKMSMAGLIDTYKWAVAGREPGGATYPLLTTAAYSQVYQDVGETEDVTLGMLTVRSYDAAYHPIAGTQVTIDSTTAAGPYYFAADGTLEAGATSSSAGTTRYVRVQPGDVEITVKTKSGEDCRPNGFVTAGPQTYPVFANANSYVRFLCD